MSMISFFDTADEAIEKSIVAMCEKLEHIHPENAEYAIIIESISKLRASLNPSIVKQTN